MKKLLFILLFLAVGYLPAQERQVGVVKGSVLDSETKQPLVGVTVSIVNSKQGTVSDNDGNFELQNVTVGIQTLTFSSIGYKTMNRADVVVNPGKIQYVNVELSPSDVEMKEVVVTGGYFTDVEDKPVSTINFSSEEIRRSPGTAGDVSRILLALPSVAKVNDQRNSLIVRGGTPVENSFYLDNIEIPNINHFPVEGSSDGPIGILNADFIDNVNFYSGGFSAAYGDRMSSIMELSYREGNKKQFVPKISLSMAGVGAALEGPLSDNATLLFSFSRSYIDLIVEQIEEGAPLPKYGDAQMKLTYSPNTAHKFTMLNVLSIDDINMDKDKAVENDANMYGRTNGLTNTFGINWRMLLGESGYMNTSVSHTYTGYDRDYALTRTKSNFYSNQTVENLIKLRNVSFLKLNEIMSAEFGIEAVTSVADYDTYYGRYEDLFGNVRQPLTVNDDITNTKVSAFYTHRLNLSHRLRLDVGARADYFSANKKTSIAPRVTLGYSLSDKSTVALSYGIFYQQIPNHILAQNEKFEQLKTPNATHYTASFATEVFEATRLTVEAYYKDYRNFPMNPASPSLFVYDEAQVYGMFWSQASLLDNGRADAKGIEIMLQKKLAADFYGFASASFSETRYRDLSGTWHRRIYDNKFTFNVEGGYIPGNDWEFKLRWTYAGGIPYTPFDETASKAAGYGIWDLNRINTNRLPDYHSMNVRVDKKFYFSNSSLLVYLSVWNAYGRENIGAYFWNEIKNTQDSMKQWSTLPVLGVEYEF